MGLIHYFPSFEVVRWIAPNLHIPAFGLEDGASRHVSTPILQAICTLFTGDFIRWKPSLEGGPAGYEEPAATAGSGGEPT